MRPYDLHSLGREVMTLCSCASRRARIARRRFASTSVLPGSWLSLVVLLALAAPTLLAAPASAVPITVEFTGVVAVGTVGWGTATVGDPVSGSFTIDDGLTDAIATDGAARWGVFASTPGMTATLTAGGKTANADSLNDTNGTFLQLFDDSPNDVVSVSVGALNLSLLELPPPSTALQGLLDGVTADPLANGLAILDGIDPADFTNSTVSTWIVDSTETIRFNLTDFTVIPEPSTGLLVGAGLLLVARRRRQS